MTQNNFEKAKDPIEAEYQGKIGYLEARFKRLYEEWSIRLEARERSLIQKEARLQGLIADFPRFKKEITQHWPEPPVSEQVQKEKPDAGVTPDAHFVAEFKQKMEQMEREYRVLLEQIVQEETVRHLDKEEPAGMRSPQRIRGYLDKIKNYFKPKKRSKLRRGVWNVPAYSLMDTSPLGPQESRGEMNARIITVANQKGGCGKTTTCINLAMGLAKKGYRVLIIDMDPQAHASLGLGIDVYGLDKSIYDVLIHDAPIPSVIVPTYQKNLDIVPASSVLTGAPLEMADLIGRESLLKMSLIKMLTEDPEKYEYILMDCSPSLDLLTINALVAAWRILVPIQAHYFSLEGMRELFSTIQIVREKYNPQLDVLGILPTIFDPTSTMSRQMLTQLSEYFKDKLLNSIIHVNLLLAEASSHGKAIFDFAPDSNAADDIWGLVDEIIRITYPTETSRSQKLGISGISA